MDHSKRHDIPTATLRIAALKDAVRGFVSGSGQRPVLADFLIDFDDSGTDNQYTAFAEANAALLESAQALIDMYLNGYISEAEKGHRNFDLQADNLMLKMEVLSLRNERQNIDLEDIASPTYNDLTKSLETLNNRYLEQAEFRKALEQLVNERTTELEMANAELQNRNKELSSFAYISSHDLQEPLRKIQTYSSIILAHKHANLSESGKKNFTRMQLAATRMTKLIQDLLTYSRTNAAEETFEPTDLNNLLAEIQTEFADTLEDKHGKLVIGDMPVISAIPFQIRQLFNNLISNALKFSKEGVPPIVQISAATVKGDTIDNPKRQEHLDYVHIEVADNGIGFSPEYASRIFEVFQRLHGRSEYEGTGIGLAICMKIADNHHAILNATSKPDEGAVFHIYFPIS